MTSPTFALSKTVLGSPDPRALAAFYRGLLGWQLRVDRPEWVVVTESETGPASGALAFQLEEGYVAPVWPAGPRDQQMQAHLDLAVDDLPAGVDRALELGAVLAAYQPQDDVRVLLDPHGHPFCLFQRR